MGKDYYVKSSPEYKRLFNFPRVFDFFENNDKNDILLLCDQIRVSNLMGGNPIRLRFSKPTIASFVHIAVM